MLNKFKILSIFILLNSFGSAQDAGASSVDSSVDRGELQRAVQGFFLRPYYEGPSEVRSLQSLAMASVIKTREGEEFLNNFVKSVPELRKEFLTFAALKHYDELSKEALMQPDTKFFVRCVASCFRSLFFSEKNFPIYDIKKIIPLKNGNKVFWGDRGPQDSLRGRVCVMSPDLSTILFCNLTRVTLAEHLPDDKILIKTETNNGLVEEIFIWDPNTGCAVRKLGEVKAREFIAFIGGNLILHDQKKKVLKVVDSDTNECLFEFEGPTYANNIKILPNNNIAVRYNSDGIKVWNPTEKRLVCRLDYQEYKEKNVFIGGILSNGNIVTCSCDDGLDLSQIWDSNTGKCVGLVKKNCIYNVEICPNGKIAILSKKGGHVGIYDPITGELLIKLTRKRIKKFIILPNNNIVTISQEWKKGLVDYKAKESIVEMWDVNTGECLGRLDDFVPYHPAHSNGADNIFFSDGNIYRVRQSCVLMYEPGLEGVIPERVTFEDIKKALKQENEFEFSPAKRAEPC